MLHRLLDRHPGITLLTLVALALTLSTGGQAGNGAHLLVTAAAAAVLTRWLLQVPTGTATH